MQGRGSSNHCVCVCVCVSACVSERENPGKFGGRRDNIPFVLLSRLLVIQLKRFVRDQDEYIIQDIVNIRRGVGTQEWGQSIHTSRLLGQVSLLCTE